MLFPHLPCAARPDGPDFTGYAVNITNPPAAGGQGIQLVRRKNYTITGTLGQPPDGWHWGVVEISIFGATGKVVGIC